MPGPGQRPRRCRWAVTVPAPRHHEAGDGPASPVLDDGDAAGHSRQGPAPDHGDAAHPGESEVFPFNPKGIGLQPDALAVVASPEAGRADSALVAPLQMAPPVAQGLIRIPESLLEGDVGNLRKPRLLGPAFGLGDPPPLEFSAAWVRLPLRVEVPASCPGVVPDPRAQSNVLSSAFSWWGWGRWRRGNARVGPGLRTG